MEQPEESMAGQQQQERLQALGEKLAKDIRMSDYVEKDPCKREWLALMNLSFAASCIDAMM